MLAHMRGRARAVGAADFSTTEKRGRDCARGRALSKRESESIFAATADSLPTRGIWSHRWLHNTLGQSDGFLIFDTYDGYHRMSNKCDRNTCRSRADMLSILNA
jgi:hypothetical protein